MTRSDSLGDVIVIGGGAVGVALAAAFRRIALEPSIVARPGSVNGMPPVKSVSGWWFGDGVALPVGTWTDCLGPRAEEHQRTLFVATKSYHLADLAKGLRTNLSANDFVVLTQNGLNVEEELRGAVPITQLARLILDFGAVREGSHAHITYVAAASRIGAFHPEAQERCAAVAATLSRAGLEVQVSDDIARATWRKTIVSAMGIVCALTDKSIGEALSSDECVSFYEKLAHERVALAAACGYRFDRTDLDSCRDNNRAAAAHIPSILHDRRQHRPLELEHDVDMIVTSAKRHGIPVPHNEAAARRLRDLMELGEN